MNKLTGVFFLIIILFCSADPAKAQLPDDLGEGLIRIANPGQLADTVNVWGDLRVTGRYLLPRGTTVTRLISYGGGPAAVGDRAPFAKVRLRIHLSRFNENTGREELQLFQLRYDEPIPFELRNYELSNEEIVVIEVKRKPSFIDVLGVITPFVAIFSTAVIALDRL